MIYGYARVSTATQGRDGNSLEDQVSALTAYGCQEIIQEAYTGKTMERPAFQALLKRLSTGDTLVVTKLDRFARSSHSQHGAGGEHIDRESDSDCHACLC